MKKIWLDDEEDVYRLDGILHVDIFDDIIGNIKYFLSITNGISFKHRGKDDHISFFTLNHFQDSLKRLVLKNIQDYK